MRVHLAALCLVSIQAHVLAAQEARPPDPFEIEADSDMALAAVARGEILPLSALMPRLKAEHPGEVLNIEIDLDPSGRIEEYEFEVLSAAGRLIEVDMDARTGEITEVSDEEADDDDDDDD